MSILSQSFETKMMNENLINSESGAWLAGVSSQQPWRVCAAAPVVLQMHAGLCGVHTRLFSGWRSIIQTSY